MIEPSTHLTRDKETRDWLEGVLVDWGQWRGRTENVLGTGSQSPIAGVIGENKGRLYGDNLILERLAIQRKRLEFTRKYIKEGILDARILRGLVNKDLEQWREHKKTLIQPKDDLTLKPRIPGYNGHKYFNKIDRIIGEMNPVYRNILIKKYEDGWEISDFVREHNWAYGTAKTRISEARKELRKILRKCLK